MKDITDRAYDASEAADALREELYRAEFHPKLESLREALERFETLAEDLIVRTKQFMKECDETD